MYINNYNLIPVWAYGIEIESLSDIENLERIDLRHPKDELDLLNDVDFLFEEWG